MKKLLTTSFLFIISISVLGQINKSSIENKIDTIKTFYINGQIKDVKVYLNHKLIESTHYLPNHELAFECNIKSKILRRYYPFEDISCSHEDTLLNAFYKMCPCYTLVDYNYVTKKGIGSITTYKGVHRWGDYKAYSANGELTCIGQFNKDESVGLWTYWNGKGDKEMIYYISRNNVNEKGKSISITYTLIPIAVTFLLVFILGFIFIKIFNYNKFYISLTLFTIILYLTIFILSSGLMDDSNNVVVHFIYNYFVAVSLTFFFVTSVLSIINLVFSSQLKVNFILSLSMTIINVIMWAIISLSIAVSGGGMIG